MVILPHTTIGDNNLPHEWQQKVIILLQQLIVQLPPKELNRRLRDFFLFYISDLKVIPPGFEEQLLQLLAILQLLDDAEDEGV